MLAYDVKYRDVVIQNNVKDLAMDSATDLARCFVSLSMTRGVVVNNYIIAK